jgi:hypothetical protein
MDAVAYGIGGRFSDRLSIKVAAELDTISLFSFSDTRPLKRRRRDRRASRVRDRLSLGDITQYDAECPPVP